MIYKITLLIWVGGWLAKEGLARAWELRLVKGCKGPLFTSRGYILQFKRCMKEL